MSDAAMAPDLCFLRSRERGLSYVEVLIAVVIVALCLVPALDALRDGVRTAAAQGSQAVNQQRLKTRMEEVLANRYVTLYNAVYNPVMAVCNNIPSATVAAYSDAAGTADRLLVTVYCYDGSSPSVSDTGLLRVKVAIEGSNLSLDTLKSRW